MKPKSLSLIIALFYCSQSFAQLSIEECYGKAHQNYPSIKQYDLITKSTNYNLSNAAKGYLPQITFSAKATYQSDVVELAIDIPGMGGFGGLSRDQYSANVDINQSVWDGGVIKSRKEAIRTQSEIDTKNLDVELYALNERVNQLYFGILLFDAQLEQNRLYQEELQRNYDKVYACIQGGIANQADLDAVEVEQFKAIQNKSSLTHSRQAYSDMLSGLIGQKLSSGISLIKPSAMTDYKTDIQRPELDVFKARIKNIEAQKKQIQADLMPKIGVFVSGGYGKPGLNMLKSGFSGYYTAGAKVTWNFSTLYTNKNSKLLVDNNINSVKAQQETFLFNTGLDVSSKQSEISKYRDQLQYDDKIISLRNSVKNSSEAKMVNGTLSAIDFMRDVNSEELARQDKILHEIEMLLAVYNLRYVTGDGSDAD